MVKTSDNLEASGSRASYSKKATPSSLKEAVTDLETFCLRIDVVADQEHQKIITKMLRKMLEEQEKQFATLSNEVQNLQGKVRPIGTRDWVNAILYSINGVEKNEAILDRSKKSNGRSKQSSLAIAVHRDNNHAQAHDFTVADTHQEASEMWAVPELRTSICEQLGRPNMNQPRMPDLFLQLTTSVSARELETMRNLTSQGWPQAENIANFYLRLKYSLVDNDDKLRQSFASLQLWPKIRGKCRHLSLQGGYNMSDTIPRLRKMLMRQPVDNLRYNETTELLNLFVDFTDYPSNFRKSAPAKI